MNKQDNLYLWNKIKSFFDVYLTNGLGGTKFVIDLSEILTCSTILLFQVMFLIFLFFVFVYVLVL